MDPSKKQAIYVAILAGNITFIAFMVLFNSSMSPFQWGEFSALKTLLGLMIAGGAAGGAFFAARMGH
ncbi:MAG: hypothetical protein FJ297_11650 [Planctomycetes bacterium]|nr:hypothetical protein [Planctomycetota bacterium]